MFFEPEAVLIYEPPVCTLIPREKVLGVERKAAEGVESGAQALGTYVVFTADDGRVISKWVDVKFTWISIWAETGRLHPPS